MDHSATIGTPLVGRDPELNVIRGLLADVSVRGSALLLHGDAGIGKSALLRSASRSASSSGFRVLASSGSEAESHLPFAALYELLRPLLIDLESLPAEHRDALRRAFGLRGSADASEGLDRGSNRFFIALAAQELLAANAAQVPLLVLADDVQWWDPASREILAFVARRITAMPAIMLSAARDDGGTTPEDDGLGLSMRLRGLDPEPARHILRERGSLLSPAAERRLLAVAEGNPLALIELPIAMARSDDQPLPPGLTPEATVLPLTSRLERAFATKLRGLPADIRSVLLVAAQLDSDLVGETVVAASALLADSDVTHALDVAVEADLLTLDEAGSQNATRLRFRHPLVRSAVVQLATDAERRAVHRVLASTLAGQPDRAAWHRAAATVGPDEEVATALERSAEHALARGAPTTAAGLFEWAAGLSELDRRRGHRLLRAAELAFELARREVAERLMAEAGGLVLDEGDQARLVGLAAVFDGAPGSPADIRRIVGSAERVLAEGDRALAAYLLVGAARRCHWGDVGRPVRELVLGVAELTLTPNDPRLLQITAFLDPLGRGAGVVARLAPWVDQPTPDPATSTMLAVASFLVADFDKTMTFVNRARAGLRQQGRTELLAQALAVQAMAGIYLGRFAEADDAAEAAYELTQESRQPVWRALATLARALVQAVHGDALPAASLIDEAEQTGLLTNNRALLNRVQFTRGVTALGLDQPTRAGAELRRMFDADDVAFHLPQAVWGIDYLAESVRSDHDREGVRALLEQADALGTNTSAPGVRQAIALAHAMLAPDEAAERRFVEAATWASEATPWYRARLDLARGVWLRSQGRITESRRALRAARTVFRAVDTPGWTTRTERELLALDQAGASGTAPLVSVLSAAERQVAELAARGLSNRDIAERLYLSHRTVASHLYRIYPKLGIRSRSQLHTVLADARQARQ